MADKIIRVCEDGMKKTKNANNRKNSNQGFSLVEVLVCLAIVAIFCVPLFRGFRYSAYNNNSAHHTQEVTAYAQKTLETVKSMRIDENNLADVETQLVTLLEVAGAVSAPTTTAIPDTVQRDKFTGTYAGNDEFNRLFTVITYSQENIDIGGRIYRMDVELDPRPYSMHASERADDETADDANVYAISQVKEVDGLKFPLIADEINRYEKDQAILETLLAKAVAINKANVFNYLGDDSPDARIKTIYQNLEKRVYVTIWPKTSEAITVICDVEYEVDHGGCNVKEVYNVYTGTFDLDCGKDCSDATPAHSNFTDWKSGGKIYIFAKPYRDHDIGGQIKSNDIIIKSHYSGTHATAARDALDVYLVRGVYVDVAGVYMESDNFSLVKVNDNQYSVEPYSSTYLTGERQYGNINFHTNIKGELTTRALIPSDMEQTIGEEEPRLRSYDVTVTLTERDTGKVAANITSTKKVM